MHVLLIIEGTYPWYRGGVSEWVYRYLLHLNDLDITILQIATDEFNELDPSDALYPIPSNVKGFHRIPPPEIGENWESSCLDWYQEYQKDITTAINHCDLIHVTNTGFAGWLSGQCATYFDLPMVLTEHAIYWKEVEMGAYALECGYKIPEQVSARKQVTDAFKDFAVCTYEKAEKVITVSESNIPYQQELEATDIEYIPNGIPGDWLNKERKRNNQPVIGWVGRCAEMKNPLAFFELAECFQDRELKPTFRMLLSDANEKELQEQVRQQAADSSYVECIWNESAEEYFNAMDFLVITSHNESQPLVMLEALAHHALPVGHKVGDLTSKYGLVFDEGVTWTRMAREMELLWSNPAKFDEFLKVRYELVKRQHTWEGIFERYSKILQNQVQYQ